MADAAETSNEETQARVPKMSLDEARAFARGHHQKLIAARARLTAAQREAEVPGAQWLPRLGGVAQLVGSTANNSTTTLIGTAVVDLPRIGGTKVEATPNMQPYASAALAVGVRQELFDFGRIAAERSAAFLTSEVEYFRAASVALDVELGVTQAYYSVLAATAIEAASKSAYERALEYRNFAAANVRTGLRPPIELTRVEADVARYEAILVRVRANVRVARSVFSASIGSDSIEVDAAEAPSRESPLPALATLLQSAATVPVVRESHARAEAQRAETRRLERQARPNVFATASISARAGGASPSSGPTPPGDGLLPTVPNYDVGVVMSWPIVEATLTRRVTASRARERAFDAEAEAAARTQRTAIAAAYFDAESQEQSLNAFKRSADAARANYEQADNRFRVGLGTSTELADAQALRTETEIQLAVGRFQLARSRAVLAHAVAESH